MRRPAVLAFFLGFVISCPLPAQTDPRIRPGDIAVANLGDHSVSVFDGETGAFRGHAFPPGTGGLTNATGVAFDPEGTLYVGSSGTGQILRYDGSTGAFLGVFAEGEPLQRPFSMIFTPNGDLLVSSGPAVLQYDRGGSFQGYAARDSALEQPIGLALGPNGLLYVANSSKRRVTRFDPETGRRVNDFAVDSLVFPSDVAFGPDGDLYVSSAGSRSVVRFDGRTGAFRAIAARLPERAAPVGIAFRGSRLVIGDFAGGRLFFVETNGSDTTVREVSAEGLDRPENVAIR